jgi:glucosamine-6-phosphate deaminase
VEVIVCDTYESMSKAAARDVADVLNTKPNAVIGMATGSTPLGPVPGTGAHAPGGGS